MCQADEYEWDGRVFPGERDEQDHGQCPVEDRGDVVGEGDHEPVDGVPPLGPLVEVDARLEQGQEAKDQAVDLDQAPVPPGRLVWNRLRSIVAQSQHANLS